MDAKTQQQIHELSLAANRCLKGGDTDGAVRSLALVAKLYHNESRQAPTAAASRKLEDSALAVLDKIKKLQSLSAPPKESAAVTGGGEIPVTTFDDVVGLEEAKTTVRRMMINPINNPAVYGKYGLKPGGNILLWGPPGTGKTLFAKSVAHEVSAKFMYIKASSLVDSLVGQTAKNIDKTFGEIRGLVKRGGRVVVFFDEIDALCRKRSTSDKVSEDAVPALLQQMDGLDTDNSNISILAATNKIEIIDEGILDRFPKRIFIPLPSAEDCCKILKLYLYDYAGEVDFAGMGRQATGLSGRALFQISEEIKNLLAEREVETGREARFTEEDLVGLIRKRKQNAETAERLSRFGDE